MPPRIYLDGEVLVVHGATKGELRRIATALEKGAWAADRWARNTPEARLPTPVRIPVDFTGVWD